MTVEFLQISVDQTLPIYARSESNRRDHHYVKSKRVKEQRGVTCMMIRGSAASICMAWRLDPTLKVAITLTRIRPARRRELDTDNLASSLKAVRDGVADALGVDDGDKRLKWEYGQATGKDYFVRIQISGCS